MTLFLWSYALAHVIACAMLAALGLLALRRAGRLPRARTTPSVSLVVAVHGASPRIEACLRNLFAQRYEGPMEIIASGQSETDPGMDLVRGMDAGDRAIRCMVNPIPPGFTGIASNLEHGRRAATGDVVILCTNDMAPEPDDLSRMVGRIGAGAGLVSAVPLFCEARTLPARIYAHFYRVASLFAWAPAVMLGVSAGWGGMMAMRRAHLEEGGGLACARGRVAEDLALARNLGRRGHRSALGPPVRTPVGSMSWTDLWITFRRIAVTGARQNPFGRWTSAGLFLGQYGWLALPVLALLTGSGAAAGAALTVFLARGVFFGLAARCAEGRFRFPWEFPLVDLLFAAALCAALLRPRYRWGDVEYRVAEGDRVGVS